MINSCLEFSFAVANQIIGTTKISFSLFSLSRLDIFWNFLPFLAANISKSTSILILRLRLVLMKLYLNLNFKSLLYIKRIYGLDSQLLWNLENHLERRYSTTKYANSTESNMYIIKQVPKRLIA